MARGNATVPQSLTLSELRDEIGNVAFAFRGYNISNLGRTPELLADRRVGPLLRKYLARASDVCGAICGRHVDLISRVEQARETSLATYDEAIAMIVAVEIAQLDALREIHDIDFRKSKFLFGFSLGEIAALIAAGALEFESALSIPIAMAADAADLADDVTLGVLFSRGSTLPESDVERLCQEVNAEGCGIVGISAYLAPNSMLVIGQGAAYERFAQRRSELSTERVHLRRNDHRWPPLHTPIVWQKHITDRSKLMMQSMNVTYKMPRPNIFSLVTGTMGYSGHNVRDLVARWIDHPQHLWNAIDYTVSSGVDGVIHVGPQPNIIPATFLRLATNVAAQSKTSVGMRALSNMAKRRWLQSILPKRANLLRAADLRHANVEDLLAEA